MSSGYQPLPQSDPDASPRAADPSFRPLRASVQAEFNRPPPSWWKRALLVLALVVMGWLTVKLGGMNRKPQVIYAQRYSEQYKYRPAASPVITEHLKDGRIRIRGATLGGVGVREEDIPLSEAQRKHKEKKQREEAREAAMKQLGLKTRRKKKGRTDKDEI